jgi:hypothetical protein
MAFPNTITLKDAANADKIFVRVSSDKQRVTYALDSATLSEPLTFQVAHTMSPAPDGSNRHLFKCSVTKIDPNGRPKTAIINFTVATPKTGIDREVLDDVIAFTKNFLTSANVGAVLRGEL